MTDLAIINGEGRKETEHGLGGFLEVGDVVHLNGARWRVAAVHLPGGARAIPFVDLECLGPRVASVPMGGLRVEI